MPVPGRQKKRPLFFRVGDEVVLANGSKEEKGLLAGQVATVASAPLFIGDKHVLDAIFV